jgi:hypothetical protein
MTRNRFVNRCIRAKQSFMISSKDSPFKEILNYSYLNIKICSVARKGVQEYKLFGIDLC